MQDRALKYFFLAFCAVAVIFPLLNFYYIFPSFEVLAVEMAESESANMARHMSGMVIEDGRLMAPERMDPIIRGIVSDAHEVSRVKVYSPAAVVVYSYPRGLEGEVHRRPDFWKRLVKEKEYSKLKRRGMEAAEGGVLDRDVLEVYIPIVREGEFYGAFEVYYDLSREVAMVNKTLHRVSAVMMAIVVAGFIIVTFLVLATGPGKSTQMDRRMNIRSPAYQLFLMAVTIFSAELVIMLLLPFFPEMSRLGNALLDSFVLLFFISPLLYYFLFRPLSWLIAELERSEVELKGLLKEKEGLMRDMVQRVHNNLSMVSSMLSLHSRRLEDQAAREAVLDSAGRIRSIEMIYEMLFGSMDLGGVRAKEFFESLSVRIMRGLNVDAGRVRLLQELDDASLDVESMVACGVILNELLVNSVKHAFPGERSGEVKVSFKRNMDAGGQAVFSVSDNGVGMPEGFDLKKAGGLGFMLVRAMTDQLDGQLGFDGKAGVKVSVVFSINRDGGQAVPSE